MHYKDLVAACVMFRKQFGNPNSVFYPGCGSDSSPSRAFPDSTIVYCDPGEEGLREITNEFPRAITFAKKAEDLDPGARYDLVLDMRTHAPFEARIRDLRRGGFALVEQRGVDESFESNLLELVAVFLRKGKFVHLQLEDLERYKEYAPDYLLNPRQPKYGFANGRKNKDPLFYVFKKVV